ncbi:MAG: hypothetical protein AMK74_06350 [Nitrospira bacterium SM23_35]|nr:MAG: hypothetical protein AMK74_06350 [Nitrospira bacterium SM23_35]
MLFVPIILQTGRRLLRCMFLLLVLHCACPAVHAEDRAIDTMLDATTSYFKPLQGSILSVEGKQVAVNIGAKDSVKTGMRFQILRKEAPFRHPVTKELLGNLESLVGKLQVKEATEDAFTGIIIEGDAKAGDTVRISGLKINLLFCQSRDTDWQLAEYYYRRLKDTGRVQIIDTALETDKPEEVLEEARRLNADVALLVSTKKTGDEIFLTQKLYWVSDGLQIGSMEAKIDQALEKELSIGEKFFTVEKHQPLTQFDVPAAAKFLIMCDVDGDGKKELIFSTGTDLIVYALDRDLHPALGGITIQGSTRDHHIWIDSADINKNGKDEIIVTSMKGSTVMSNNEPTMKSDDITSSIYEYDGKAFILLYQDNVFMRKIGDKLFAQPYSRHLGFAGDVFNLSWEGTLKKGDALTLPGGVNIYDFIFFEDPEAGRLLLAYDEKGYFTVYDKNGLKLWKSKTAAGNFLTTFRKDASSAMVDRGEWSVKDRLLFRQQDILYVQRIPFLDMIKGFGYKKSRIRSLRWNGFSMEESIVVDGVDGTIMDYAVTSDNIFVLASPLFGIRAGNILKGENLVKKELSVYPLKGI